MRFILKNHFSNFNLSVGVTDLFMDAVLRDRKFDLVNPRTGKTIRAVKRERSLILLSTAP